MPAYSLKRTLALVAILLLTAGVLHRAGAQHRPRGTQGEERSLVRFSLDVTAEIRDFYRSRPASGVKALPPGIRRKLERGKPLPPGIAKQMPPASLRAHLALPPGTDLLEVGLDVVLVDIATGIIHDVLMDVVR